MLLRQTRRHSQHTHTQQDFMSSVSNVVFPSTGLSLSKIGYGAMGITAFYGPPMPDDDALALLQQVHSLGVTHFDTAEIYKTGNVFEATAAATDVFNESILGKFFQTVPCRDAFTVATKFHPNRYGGKTDEQTVRASLAASLERLGLNYVDLYYMHRMPSTLEGLVSFMNVAKALVAEGKIRFVGLSEVGPEWLRRANEIHPVAAVQQEWSLATRNIEDTIVPVCKELGIGVVAYSPLSRSILALGADASAPTDFRAVFPRYGGDNFEANKAVVARIRAIGERLGGASPAQLSLAWLYRRAEELGVVLIPIPGSTKISNVTQNVGALALELNDSDYAALTELGSQIVGPRGSEGYVSVTFESQLAR